MSMIKQEISFEITGTRHSLLAKVVDAIGITKEKIMTYLNSELDNFLTQVKSTMPEIKQEPSKMHVYDFQEENILSVVIEENKYFESPVSSMKDNSNILISSEDIQQNLNLNSPNQSEPIQSNVMSNQLKENDIESLSMNLMTPFTPMPPVELVTPNECYIQKKRKRAGLQIEPQYYIPVKKDKQEGKFQILEAVIKECFEYVGCNLSRKKIKRRCMNCEDIIPQTHSAICCDNYLCPNCIRDNISILAVLIPSLLAIQKNYICFACENEFYFCSFCMVIDNKENLIQCKCPLCMGLLHKHCFLCAIILGKLTEVLSSEFITKFYSQFSSKFLKIFHKIKNEQQDQEMEEKDKDLMQILKYTNHRQTQTQPPNLPFLLVLYKINSNQFYKLFFKMFGDVVVELYGDGEREMESSLMTCKDHTCFSCFKEVDVLISGEILKITRICCCNRHLFCDSIENPNVSVNCRRENGQVHWHSAMNHFVLFERVYDYMKTVFQHNLIVSVDKEIYLRYLERKRARDDEMFLDINSISCSCSSNLSHTQQRIMTALTEKDNEKTRIGTECYEYLKQEEIEYLLSLYRQIASSILMETEIKVECEDKTLWLPVQDRKCSCFRKLIEGFETKVNGKTEKELTYIVTNYGGYMSNRKFKNYLTNNNIKICGINSLCENRKNKIECSRHVCYSSKDYCENRYSHPQQNKKSKSTEDRNLNFPVVKTYGKGYGLIAIKNYAKGDFIMEMVGEVIDKLTLDYQIHQNDHLPDYYWSTKKFPLQGLYLDISSCSNKSRFINHSCSPNAVLEIWKCNGYVVKSKCNHIQLIHKYFIFAREEIRSGEEITMDYHHEINNYDPSLGSIAKFHCKCKSSCLNIIGKNLLCEIIIEKAKYSKAYSDLLQRDNTFWKDINVFLTTEFLRYDNLIMRNSNVFLFKNIQTCKNEYVEFIFQCNTEYFLQSRDISKYIPQKFLPFPVCRKCKEKGDLLHCTSCYMPYHKYCGEYVNEESIQCKNCRCGNVRKVKKKESVLARVNSKLCIERIEEAIKKSGTKLEMYTLTREEITHGNRVYISEIIAKETPSANELLAFSSEYVGCRMTKRFQYKNFKFPPGEDNSVIRQFLAECHTIFAEFVNQIKLNTIK